MYNLFVILVVIASIFMCLIVLIQESKGGGLASGFASGNQVMGVRKTTDVIEKATWVLAAAMVVFSVISVYMLPSASADASVMEGVAIEQQTTAPSNLPGIPAADVQETPAPAEAASHTLLKEQLNEVLNTLTDREAKVLKLRFGLEDGKARTLEEVGQRFDVTRERIRQIEAKALRKLRHPSRSRKLKDYLE